MIVAAGCTGSEIQNKEPGYYIAGIDGEFPPYSYIDPDGVITGFDVEVLCWIAEKEGIEFRFQPMMWEEMVPALTAKEIDLIGSALIITEARKQEVNFSIPYWKIYQSIVVHADDDYTMDNFLAGDLRIGALRDTIGASWVREHLIETSCMTAGNLKMYESLSFLTTELQNKNIDAVICDAPSLPDAIEGKPLVRIGDIATDQEIGFAVRKSDTDLLERINHGLSRLLQDPHYEVLQQKYRMK
jgi:polar amino acid transport system substrate-binding protein